MTRSLKGLTDAQIKGRIWYGLPEPLKYLPGTGYIGTIKNRLDPEVKAFMVEKIFNPPQYCLPSSRDDPEREILFGGSLYDQVSFKKDQS